MVPTWHQRGIFGTSKIMEKFKYKLYYEGILTKNLIGGRRMENKRLHVRVGEDYFDKISEEAKKRGVDMGELVEEMSKFFFEYIGKTEYITMMSGKLDVEWKKVQGLAEERAEEKSGIIAEEMRQKMKILEENKAILGSMKILMEAIK